MIKALFKFDESYKLENIDFVIGTDEAGRGPGAGPVFAAAVAFRSYDEKLFGELSVLNDSKQLSEKKREMLYERIIETSVYSIQQASVAEIEEVNILNASLNTMKKAVINVVKQLGSTKVKILIDGNKKIKNFSADMETVVKGDSKSASIAAASILAKVARDRMMVELDKQYPQYCWARNKGYLSSVHIEAIKKHGITIWHRKKFLRNIVQESEQLSLI